MSNTGIIDWASEKTANGTSVVLPTEKANTDVVYCSDGKGFAWRPTPLPYAANWDQLHHDGEKFIIADSGNSRLQAISLDGGKTWVDAGT